MERVGLRRWRWKKCVRGGGVKGVVDGEGRERGS